MVAHAYNLWEVKAGMLEFKVILTLLQKLYLKENKIQARHVTPLGLLGSRAALRVLRCYSPFPSPPLPIPNSICLCGVTE